MPGKQAASGDDGPAVTDQAQQTNVRESSPDTDHDEDAEDDKGGAADQRDPSAAGPSKATIPKRGRGRPAKMPLKWDDVLDPSRDEARTAGACLEQAAREYKARTSLDAAARLTKAQVGELLPRLAELIRKAGGDAATVKHADHVRAYNRLQHLSRHKSAAPAQPAEGAAAVASAAALADAVGAGSRPKRLRSQQSPVKVQPRAARQRRDGSGTAGVTTKAAGGARGPQTPAVGSGAPPPAFATAAAGTKAEHEAPVTNTQQPGPVLQPEAGGGGAAGGSGAGAAQVASNGIAVAEALYDSRGMYDPSLTAAAAWVALTDPPAFLAPLSAYVAAAAEAEQAAKAAAARAAEAASAASKLASDAKVRYNQELKSVIEALSQHLSQEEEAEELEREGVDPQPASGGAAEQQGGGSLPSQAARALETAERNVCELAAAAKTATAAAVAAKRAAEQQPDTRVLEEKLAQIKEHAAAWAAALGGDGEGGGEPQLPVLQHWALSFMRRLEAPQQLAAAEAAAAAGRPSRAVAQALRRAVRCLPGPDGHSPSGGRCGRPAVACSFKGDAVEFLVRAWPEGPAVVVGTGAGEPAIGESAAGGDGAAAADGGAAAGS